MITDIFNKKQKLDESIDRLKLMISPHKVVREDQFNACFFHQDRTKLPFFTKFWNLKHLDAIAATRDMQARGEIPYGQIHHMNIREEDIDPVGVFPLNQVNVTIKPHSVCQTLGLEVPVAQHDITEDQGPYIPFARLGDLLDVWENFHPVLNLSTVSWAAKTFGDKDSVVSFWENIYALPNHTHMFNHDFDWNEPPSWPRNSHHLNYDNERRGDFVPDMA